MPLTILDNNSSSSGGRFLGCYKGSDCCKSLTCLSNRNLRV
ncbi:hypothetical protein ACFE35_22030 [Phormidesmis priestleyi ANT.L61.2]